ncbi:hypothetical protein [Lonepinella sp. BR2357]|uniref:hypothetical protein n=1 Tax=Lonepinella sp. BR2357 TaxID=3434549 RepID=UPI003F6DBF68
MKWLKFIGIAVLPTFLLSACFTGMLWNSPSKYSSTPSTIDKSNISHFGQTKEGYLVLSGDKYVLIDEDIENSKQWLAVLNSPLLKNLKLELYNYGSEKQLDIWLDEKTQHYESVHLALSYNQPNMELKKELESLGFQYVLPSKYSYLALRSKGKVYKNDQSIINAHMKVLQQPFNIRFIQHSKTEQAVNKTLDTIEKVSMTPVSLILDTLSLPFMIGSAVSN